tara:strand:- start:879 stop:1625 length:747 start_codon:yes stop_codon:yes gene_type:complete
MSEIKSYPVNSDKLKNNVLFCALQKFYDQCPSDDKQMFLDIINGKSKMSLRIIDWFITNYTKKFNIIYYIPKKKRSVKRRMSPKNNYYESSHLDQASSVDRFIVYLRYRSQLKSYNKANFDPFCRNDRITGWGDDGDIVTTIGQLNFFRWAIENRVLEYINDNLEDIEIDMNTNIKKNLKKNKKSLKSKKEGGKQPEQEVVNNSDSEAVIESDKVSEIKSLKKKRRELSKCATKTLNKHRGAIVLDFN